MARRAPLDDVPESLLHAVLMAPCLGPADLARAACTSQTLRRAVGSHTQAWQALRCAVRGPQRAGDPAPLQRQEPRDEVAAWWAKSRERHEVFVSLAEGRSRVSPALQGRTGAGAHLTSIVHVHWSLCMAGTLHPSTLLVWPCKGAPVKPAA